MTSIGDWAFSYNRLADLSLPSGVTSLGESVFRGNPFTELVLPEGLTDIGRYAFSGCRQLTNVTLPSTVTTIDDLAFAWGEVLELVTFHGPAPELGGDQVFWRTAPGLVIQAGCDGQSFSGDEWSEFTVEIIHLDAGLAISGIEKRAEGALIRIGNIHHVLIGVEFSPDLTPGSWIDLGNFYGVQGCQLEFFDPDQIRAGRTEGYYRAFLR